MPYYYLDTRQMSNGEYDIHRSTCHHLPCCSNRVEIGSFPNSKEALAEAQKIYPEAACCYLCCDDWKQR
jgi:hypothetical protein